MVEELCLRCKTKNRIVEVSIVKTSNNRTRLVGKCDKCDAKVSKFIKNEDASLYTKHDDALRTSVDHEDPRDDDSTDD